VFGKAAPSRRHAQERVFFGRVLRLLREPNALARVVPVLLSLPHTRSRIPGKRTTQTPIGSIKRMNLNGNSPEFHRLPIRNSGNNCHAEIKMENPEDNARGNSEKFRTFAAECRRLAQRASEKDRKVLMEIAEAWLACAEEAERKENSLVKKQ
jgi:hypothetical protein